MKYRQNQPYGCGLYAVANALDLDDFVTEERLEISKGGNNTGQLSRWLQQDGHPYYIDVLYWNYTAKALPHSATLYHPVGDGAIFPILLNVNVTNEKTHLAAGKIDTGKILHLHDSLRPEVVQTTLRKVNKLYLRVFGLYTFNDINTSEYIVLKP